MFLFESTTQSLLPHASQLTFDPPWRAGLPELSPGRKDCRTPAGLGGGVGGGGPRALQPSPAGPPGGGEQRRAGGPSFRLRLGPPPNPS